MKKYDTKRDKGLALKITEDAYSDNEKEIDMSLLARQFKKFLRNTKGTEKKKNPNKSKDLDRISFNGWYKCGKFDHIIKDYTQWKIEWEC